MKKNNKKDSFASRARKLEKLYTRAKFDKKEADELEQKLTELQVEQEEYRTAHGMNQPQGQPQPMQGQGMEQMMEQGMMGQMREQQPQQQFQFGGGLTGLQNQFVQHQDTLNQVDNSQLAPGYGAFINPTMGTIADQAYGAASEGLDPMNTLSATEITGLNRQADRVSPFGTKVGDTLRTAGQNPYMPSYLAGASNIGGNLLLAALAGKNIDRNKIAPSMTTPQRMNLESQAEQLRKQAGVSKNIAMRNARNLGLNAGATMSNITAASAGIDRGLGANLTSLYGQQEQFNVGTANQFALANQAARSRANMFNAQVGLQGGQDRLDYLAGALQEPSLTMKDIRMGKADKETRDIMDRYYKNSGGRNYLAVGSLFEEGGLTYKVKALSEDGTPSKIEKVKK